LLSSASLAFLPFPSLLTNHLISSNSILHLASQLTICISIFVHIAARNIFVEPFHHFIYLVALSTRLSIMKGALLTAAALLGSAQAGVHKMKLNKVPLADQLVC
jgi:hypothetical protein